MCTSQKGEKTSLFFIEEGVKVNQHVFGATERQIGALGERYDWRKRNHSSAGWSHIPHLIQEWCKKNMVGFWPKELRPPSSPDANPMDFAIWSILESKACSSNHQNIESLMLELKSCWDEISQETIRASCNQVADRLGRAVKVKSGYIEK